MTLRVSCFGKLPFHREFLRQGLGSPSSAWVVHWIERAHEAISRAKDPSAAESAGLLRFLAPRPGGDGLIAGVVRQSTDGLRKHPVAFFVEDESAGLAARWHLAPLALVGVWGVLAEMAGRTYGSLDEFAAALGSTVEPPDFDAAGRAWQEGLAEVNAAGPWTALTDADGDAGRHLALNLRAVARAQRDARSAEEGVTFAVSLAGPDEAARLLRAGIWVDLFRAIAGSPPSPAILLDTGPDRLFGFYRPVEGADLAALLSRANSQSIDDLGDAWQEMPPKDAGLAAALEAIVAPEPAPLAALAGRVQVVG